MKQLRGAVVFFGAQIQWYLSILKLTMDKLLECVCGMEINTDAEHTDLKTLIECILPYILLSRISNGTYSSAMLQPNRLLGITFILGIKIFADSKQSCKPWK